jgi:DNA-binding ferritin-like protein
MTVDFAPAPSTVLRAAEAAGDAATIALATRRLAVHETTRWMLRATGAAGAA